jgi:hypothetical protein
MDIKETSVNIKFVYDTTGKKITGIEFDVSIVVNIDLASESEVKWQYVEFLNDTYEQAKHRIKSVVFSG